MSHEDGRSPPWNEERVAWDRYAASALATVAPAFLRGDVDDAAIRASDAARLADAMLAERRKRIP